MFISPNSSKINPNFCYPSNFLSFWKSPLRPVSASPNIFGCEVFYYRVVHLPGATFIDKTKANICHFFPWHVPSSPLPCWGLVWLWPDRLCAIVTITVPPYTQLPCCVVPVQWSAVPGSCTLHAPSSENWFLSLRGSRGASSPYILHRADHAVVSFTLHFDQLWVWVLITTYSK